jgi:hypothetical protein
MFLTNFDFDYSVLSAAPIRKLWISYESLFPTPAPVLASITPSLAYFTMSIPEHFIRSFEKKVGPPLYLFEFEQSNIEQVFIIGLCSNKWLETLLANLVTLRVFHIHCDLADDSSPHH